MAPHTLMQMSLTINTPYPSTCSLSPPVSKLHSSVTDTTTSSCFTQVAHVPSRVTIPPVCSSQVMHVPRHHCLHTLSHTTLPPTTPRSHMPMFIPRFATFVRPCS